MSSTCAGDLHAQRRGGLVEQQHPRRPGDRPGHRDQLALAAGQRADAAGGVAQRHAEALQQLHRVGVHPHVGAQLAAVLAAEHEVRGDVQVVAQGQVLPDHADAVPGQHAGVGRHRPCRTAGSPRRRLDVAADAAHQRGLARAVLPGQGDDLALADAQADAVQGAHRAEAHRQVRHRQQRRRRGRRRHGTRRSMTPLWPLISGGHHSQGRQIGAAQRHGQPGSPAPRRAGQPGGQEGALGLVVGQRQRGPVGLRRLGVAARAAQQVGLGRGQVAVPGQPPVPLPPARAISASPAAGPLTMASDHGPVQRHHRRRPGRQQLVVQARAARASRSPRSSAPRRAPPRWPPAARTGRARPPAQRADHQRGALGDGRLVPAGPVLVGQQQQPPVGVRAGSPGGRR